MQILLKCILSAGRGASPGGAPCAGKLGDLARLFDADGDGGGADDLPAGFFSERR